MKTRRGSSLLRMQPDYDEALEERDEWMDREDVAAVCPLCAEKMDAEGITRVRASVIRRAQREAMMKESSVRNAAAPRDIATYHNSSGYSMSDESLTNFLRVEFGMSDPDENGDAVMYAHAKYVYSLSNHMTGREVERDGFEDDEKLPININDRRDMIRKMEGCVERLSRRTRQGFDKRKWTLPGKRIPSHTNGLLLRSVLQRMIPKTAASCHIAAMTVRDIRSKLWRAITRSVRMPPIKEISEGGKDIDFLTEGGLTVHFDIVVTPNELGWDDVRLDWESYWSGGDRKGKGSIPIVDGPRRYGRWMTTAVSIFKKQMRGSEMNREAVARQLVLAARDLVESGRTRRIAAVRVVKAVPATYMRDGDQWEIVFSDGRVLSVIVPYLASNLSIQDRRMREHHTDIHVPSEIQDIVESNTKYNRALAKWFKSPRISRELANWLEFDVSSSAVGSSRTAALKEGDRVKISGGSGVLSGKEGVVVDKKTVKTDGRGIPTNVEGAYKPVDWNKEVAIRLDDGEIVTMFKNRVRKATQRRAARVRDINEITGAELFRQYDWLYGEFSDLKVREERGDVPEGSYEDEKEHFEGIFEDWLSDVRKAVNRNDPDAFRRIVSLSRSNYQGKKTKALMRLMMIRRAKNIQDLFDQMYEATHGYSASSRTAAKKVRLTRSEINNAEKSFGGGRRYTIVRRPQAKGGFWVAAIDIDSQEVITDEYAETKEDVRKAVREVNRWMDKAYGGGPMSDKSRHRQKASRTAAYGDEALLRPKRGEVVLMGLFDPPRGASEDEITESEILDETIQDLQRRARKIPALRGFRVKGEHYKYQGGRWYGVLVLRGRPFDLDEMTQEMSSKWQGILTASSHTAAKYPLKVKKQYSHVGEKEGGGRDQLPARLVIKRGGWFLEFSDGTLKDLGSQANGPNGFRKREMEKQVSASVRTADRWETMPEGWTGESRKKFWESLTGRAPKHKVSACMRRMEGKVDDPGAFCAALADRILGRTDWRGED